MYYGGLLGCIDPFRRRVDAVAFTHRSVACYRAGIAGFGSQESYIFPRAMLCIVVNKAQPG